MVLAKKVYLSYCPTMDMAADVLTKPLDRVKFEHFRAMLGLEKSKDVASGSVENQSKGNDCGMLSPVTVASTSGLK